MNIIILNNNKIEVIQDRTAILSNPDMKLLEECDDYSLKDKVAYWNNIIFPEPEPRSELRFDKFGIKIYKFIYE